MNFLHNNMIPFKLSWAYARPEHLTVFASKVAVMADMHPYQDRQELTDEYTFLVTGMKPHDDYEPDERVVEEKIIQALPEEVEQKVRIAIETGIDTNDTAEVTKIVDEIKADPDVPEAASRIVQKTLYTTHGTNMEEGIRQENEKQTGNTIVKTIKFLARAWFRIGTPDPENVNERVRWVFVGGRHDGYDPKQQRIVEIKTRQRRFLGVPEYERIQLHVYMHIMDVQRATLIESFKGQQKEHNVMFDRELWQEVTKACKEYIESVACTGVITEVISE